MILGRRREGVASGSRLAWEVLRHVSSWRRLRRLAVVSEGRRAGLLDGCRGGLLWSLLVRFVSGRPAVVQHALEIHLSCRAGVRLQTRIQMIASFSLPCVPRRDISRSLLHGDAVGIHHSDSPSRPSHGNKKPFKRACNGRGARGRTINTDRGQSRDVLAAGSMDGVRVRMQAAKADRIVFGVVASRGRKAGGSTNEELSRCGCGEAGRGFGRDIAYASV